MKRICIFLILSLGCTANGDDGPQVQEPVPVVSSDKPISFWMAQKVEHSKRILEALTKEDFVQLESESNKLRTIGKIEGFVRRKDPIYRRHQKSFDSSLLDIAAHARSQNVEGATLAFNQMTTSCVMCHKMLRTDTSAVKTDVK